jgi:hypothetical protein
MIKWIYSVICFLLLWVLSTLDVWAFMLDRVYTPITSLWFSSIYNFSFFERMSVLWTLLLWYKIWSVLFLALTLLTLILLPIYLKKYTFIKNKSSIYALILVSGSYLLMSPFVYERIVTQIGVLFGIICIFRWTIFLLEGQFSRTKNIYAWLMYGIAWSAFPHWILFIWLIYLCFIVIFVRSYRTLKILLSSMIIVLLINSTLLISWLMWFDESIINKVNQISSENIEAFQITNLENLSAEVTWWLQYWFRWERYGHVLVPWEIYRFWRLWWLLISLVSLFWIWYLFYDIKTRKVWFFLALLGFFSWVLWVGIWWKYWWEMIRWLHTNIPLYNGMRDSQKWIWILMGVQRVWRTWGLSLIFRCIYSLNISVIINKVALFLIVFTSIWILHVWNPHMPHALRQQIIYTQWPKEYMILEQILAPLDIEWSILVLPWHSYLKCDWTMWATLPVLIDKFAEEYIFIVSDNIEIGDLYTNSSSLVSSKVKEAIVNKNWSVFSELWISHVLVLSDCWYEDEWEWIGENLWGEKTYNTSTWNVVIYSIL